VLDIALGVDQRRHRRNGHNQQKNRRQAIDHDDLVAEKLRREARQHHLADRQRPDGHSDRRNGGRSHDGQCRPHLAADGSREDSRNSRCGNQK